MTDNERMFARAIAPGMVVYAPGIGTKRFARDMATLERLSPAAVLSPKQAIYLRQVVVRFRRQIPADIVRIARAEMQEMEAQTA
jgi:hypothetical protein